MGQWFQRFLAGGLHDEVSDATIQGYLRSAGQIEELWQQIDDQVDALIVQGMAPWEAYARLGYALAFVRACRTNTVFVQELLRAATASTTHAGYMPRVTYEQALALCEHIEPYMEEAIKASANPRYVPTPSTFPLALGPRIRYMNQRLPLPLPHLQGMIGAAQQMRDWAAGLLAKYELALSRATTPVPPAIATHVEEVKSELKLGDFHVRTGIDMVGQISTGHVTDELSERAEGFIWEAMESFFKVSQLVANPQAFVQPPAATPDVIRHEQPSQSNYAPPDQSSYVPPEASQVAQPPASPDVSTMLNQVATGPGAILEVPSHVSPDLPDMLSQVTGGANSAQKAPRAPTASAQPTADVSDILNQVITGPNTAQAAPGEAHVVKHAPEHKQPTPEDNVLDMLSDICGEQ